MDCVAANRELSSQMSSNDKKLKRLMQGNDDLQAQLEDARQKLKEIQNSQNQIIKSNKRMSSVLANSASQ